MIQAMYLHGDKTEDIEKTLIWFSWKSISCKVEKAIVDNGNRL